MFAATM